MKNLKKILFSLLFLAVFAVGLIGSLVSRFQAKGMANTLFTASAVQMLVPVIALFLYKPETFSWSPGILGVFLLTAFFALIFLISGYLFKRSV